MALAVLRDFFARNPLKVKNDPKQHVPEVAAFFSEFKQNRPPNREVRGPILAKRGSYSLISKGWAKTNQTWFLTK
jgi:hypothetical protein